MNVKELINDNSTSRHFSFEVLPPLKGNGTGFLFSTIDKLKEFNPLYINITTHHSEYIYRELESGQYERLRIRRRPGTIAIAAAISELQSIAQQFKPLSLRANNSAQITRFSYVISAPFSHTV